MNRKFFALLLVVTLIMTVMAGCKQEPKQSDNAPVNDKSVVDNENTQETKVEAVDVKKVFVSPQWVKSVIDGEQEESKKHIVLEASWGTANDSPDYNKGHILGAVHVDILI
ncbi:hypothetical protein [Tissierella praeacuta]|uniref:hypothetical protein n=1 Tax=Tissierella praeacuta TaxID=43131 RepID=UPI00333F89F1